MSIPATCSLLLLLTCAGCSSPTPEHPLTEPTVAATLTRASTANGQYIAWAEHRIDDEALTGVATRGGDGLKLADFDRDGRLDVVSVHEDSHHLRIAFATATPNVWEHITVASGRIVGAIEDVAVGDLNGDGWPDLAVACEQAHLAYFQNPAQRTAPWPHLVPAITRGRGSWLQVTFADMTGDGQLELIGANKGFADVVTQEQGNQAHNATALFTINGDPLTQAAWQEQVLVADGIPNQALTADVDNDGDQDVLGASRLANRMWWFINEGTERNGTVRGYKRDIRIAAGFPTTLHWRAAANAFNAELVDMDGDGRLDLVVNVLEFDDQSSRSWDRAGLAWLQQPRQLSDPWILHRIGTLLPDWVIGIGVADIDGDGDLDAVTGGYSGLNVLDGGYSGASRAMDDPAVNATATVARLAWFENPGDLNRAWERHDISRRVRGMFDEFGFTDLNDDGALDVIATRGNSGALDGVFWLEQRRSRQPMPAFTNARASDSKALPLAPQNWRERYTRAVQHTAPNKAAQTKALEQSAD